MEESTASLVAGGEDVRPYKMHVSSKYLTLTKRKLELTRLPHEILLPKSREWENGTPKGEIEPLIDYWLEEYSWRTREAYFNSSLPQYRIAMPIPGQVGTLLRVHFIHIESTKPEALPLLLLPSFPLTNLSLISLFAALTEPEEGEQAFHVVCPSFPGLGFSDAFNLSSSHERDAQNGVLKTTAQLLDTLMQKLGYQAYLTSSTGSGSASPAHIDYHIPRLLAQMHSDTCLGIHVLDPPLTAPSWVKEPWVWTKFAVAKFFHAPIFGYVSEDWKALAGRFSSTLVDAKSQSPPAPTAEIDLEAQNPPLPPPSPPQSLMKGSIITSNLGLSSPFLFNQPNTLSYALCDSPVGLLSLVLAGLRHLSSFHSLTRMEIIDIVQLSWLPGPEAAMRFWSSAAAADSSGEELKGWGKTATAVTSFLGDGSGPRFMPPVWAASRHNVVFAQRKEGRAGLVLWESAPVIIDGIRGLASAVLKIHPEMVKKQNEALDIEIDTELSGVIIHEEGEVGGEMQIEVESPDTVILAREL